MVKSIDGSRIPQHRNPIPAAAIHRGILMTSGIFGKEIETGDFPQSKERQVELAFAYLRSILEEAGASLQDVIKVDLHFACKADRPLANVHWVRFWPDSGCRPARHAHQSQLPRGCCIQIFAMAVLEEEH